MSYPSPDDYHFECSRLISEFGEQCRIRYFSYSFAVSGDYDNPSLTQSGSDIWTYGFKQNINKPDDYEYLAQGRLLRDDSKLYIAGSINLTPSNGQYKIGIGSPIKQEYSVLSEGCNVYVMTGSAIYTKSYLRVLNNGSFINE